MRAFAVVSLVVLGVQTRAAGPSHLSPSSADTVRLEVGSRAVNGNYYPAHVGHNTVTRISSGREDTTGSWINTLEIGDSAGIKVHRWHTGGTTRSQTGQMVRFDLWQTFDARTLALYGYHRRGATGAEVKLTIKGTRVTGTRKPAADAPEQPIEYTLPRAGFPSGAADLIPPAVGLKEGLVIIMPVWNIQAQTVVDQIWAVRKRADVPLEGRSIKGWELEVLSASGESEGRLWVVDESPYMVRWDVHGPGGAVTRINGVNARK